jgi:bifunctional oligoribonuclease and PAP phosphatase NrnA
LYNFGIDKEKMEGRNNTLIWHSMAKAVKMLQGPPKRIVFLIHPNPDGDALGSALGLSKLLGNRGHYCNVISPNDFPDFLKWMPGANDICLVSEELNKSFEMMKQADVIFVVDCNDLSRLSELNEVFTASNAYKLMIDHHPGPELKVDCILSDTSVSSTAELVYRFILEAGFQASIDRDVADCLFTGIMTDTGCFSHNSSDRKTWETVAALLDFGIDKDEIYSRVYDNYSAERMRLLGFSLNEKMEILEKYHTAYISLSKFDLSRHHFQPGDTEGFVNFPLSVKGICFSVLFLEKDDLIKISFRSKGNFAVNEFSRKYFNGGGHVNASGGESYESMQDTIVRFKSLLPEFEKELSNNED